MLLNVYNIELATEYVHIIYLVFSVVQYEKVIFVSDLGSIMKRTNALFVD